MQINSLRSYLPRKISLGILNIVLDINIVMHLFNPFYMTLKCIHSSILWKVVGQPWKCRYWGTGSGQKGILAMGLIKRAGLLGN